VTTPAPQVHGPLLIKTLAYVLLFPRSSVASNGQAPVEALSAKVGVNTSDLGPSQFTVETVASASTANPTKEGIQGCACCRGGFQEMKVGASLNSNRKTVQLKKDYQEDNSVTAVWNPGKGAGRLFATISEDSKFANVQRIDANGGWSTNPTLYLCKGIEE